MGFGVCFLSLFITVLYVCCLSVDQTEQLLSYQSVFRRSPDEPQSLLQQVCSGKTGTLSLSSNSYHISLRSSYLSHFFLTYSSPVSLQTELTGLKLAALESNKSLDLEKKEGRIDDLLRVSLGAS